MSAIIAKPFDWAKKIVHAVFRGSPNLITAEDLNRQIVALKKELYLQQQCNRFISSDFNVNVSPGTVTCSGSVIFIEGMLISDANLNRSFSLPATSFSTYLINLYAEKTLVTFSDDSSHDISGAVFADSSAMAAADHYVYGNAEIALVPFASPDADYEYADHNSKKYVCTLAMIQVRDSTSPIRDRYWVSSFTRWPGSHVAHDNLSPTRGDFPVSQPTASQFISNLIPTGSATLNANLKALWTRLYNLERRLFLETTCNYEGINSTIDINGQTYNNLRHYSVTRTNANSYGTYTIEYWFFIVGNICFMQGHIQIEKVPTDPSDAATKYVQLHFTDTDGEAPRPLSYGGDPIPMIMVAGLMSPVVKRVTGATFSYDGQGAIPSNAVQLQYGKDYYPANTGYGFMTNSYLRFGSFQVSGTFHFQVTYPFDSHRFWAPADTDNLGPLDGWQASSSMSSGSGSTPSPGNEETQS